MADYLVRVTGGGINGHWPWYCDVNGLYCPTDRPSWRNWPDQRRDDENNIPASGNAVLWRGGWMYGDCWMLTPYDNYDDPNWGDYQNHDWNSPWAQNHYRAVALGNEITGEEEWYSCGANSVNANPPPTVERLPVPEFWDAYGWWCWLVWGDGPYFGPNPCLAPCSAVLAGKNYLVLPTNQRGGGIDGFTLWQMDGRHAFSFVEAATSLTGGSFGWPECDIYNRGGAFDAGDGEHIYINGGAYESDLGGWYFTFKTFSVVPGGGATETDSVTVSLPSGEITNFVEVEPGQFRFMLIAAGNVYFCSYVAGATTYTAGTAVSLPALPEYYQDVLLATDRKDQALLKVNDTFYWFRDIYRGTMSRRVQAYEVAAGVVTPLSDVIEVPQPIVTNTQAGSSYGAYGGTIYGHFGKDSYNDAGIVWTPGSDGQPGYEEGYPGAQCWFVRAANGQLYLMGWCDESYAHKPFVVKVSPIPVTVSHGVMVEWTGGMVAVEDITRLRADGAAATAGDVALEVAEVEPVELAAAGEAVTVGEVVLAHDLPGAGEAHTEGAAVLEATPQTLLLDLSGEANAEGATVLQSSPEAILAGLAGEAHTAGAVVLAHDLQAGGAARTSGRVEMSKYLMPAGGEANTSGGAVIARHLRGLFGSAATEGEADLARAFTAHGAARTAGEVQLAHAVTGDGEARTRGNAALGHGLVAEGEANATGAAAFLHIVRNLAGAARTAGDAVLEHGLQAAGTARTAGAALIRRGLSVAGEAATSGNTLLAHGLPAEGASQATGEGVLGHGVNGAGRARTSGSCQLAHGVGGEGTARTSGRGAVGRVLLVVGAAETSGAAQVALALKAAGGAQATGEADLRRGLSGAGAARTTGAARIALELPAEGEARSRGACTLARGMVATGEAQTAGAVTLQVWLTVSTRGVARTSGEGLVARGVVVNNGAARTVGGAVLAHGLPEAAGEATATGNAALHWQVNGAGRTRTAGEAVLAHGLCGDGAARAVGNVKLARVLIGAGEAGAAGEAGLHHLLPKIEPGQARAAGEVVLSIAPGLWSPLPRRHMDVRMERGEQNIDLRVRDLHVERETAVMELL